MRFWQIFCFIICLSGTSSLSAQGFTHPSEIGDAFNSHDSKIVVGLDSRRSFIGRTDVNIWGVRAGLDFQGKVRLGAGAYFLRTPLPRQFIIDRPGIPTDTISSELRFSYLSLFIEPVVFSSKRWEMDTPFHLGIGDNHYPQAPKNGGGTRKTVLLTELSVTGTYKILPWIGVGGGVGYRLALKGNKSNLDNFNAPIYQIGLRFFAGYIYKAIFKPEELTDW